MNSTDGFWWKIFILYFGFKVEVVCDWSETIMAGLSSAYRRGMTFKSNTWGITRRFSVILFYPFFSLFLFATISGVFLSSVDGFSRLLQPKQKDIPRPTVIYHLTGTACSSSFNSISFKLIISTLNWLFFCRNFNTKTVFFFT